MVAARRIQPVRDGVSVPYWLDFNERKFCAQLGTGSVGLRWPPLGVSLSSGGEEPSQRIETSGRGAVWTYSVVHRSSHAWPVTPYVLAVVQLEEGLFVTTNILDIRPDHVYVGLPVRVDFEPMSDDQGGQQLLPVFVPI